MRKTPTQTWAKRRRTRSDWCAEKVFVGEIHGNSEKRGFGLRELSTVTSSQTERRRNLTLTATEGNPLDQYRAPLPLAGAER